MTNWLADDRSKPKIAWESKWVICWRPLPSRRTDQMLPTPFSSWRRKRIDLPSGWNLNEETSPAGNGILTVSGRPPSMGMVAANSFGSPPRGCFLKSTVFPSADTLVVGSNPGEFSVVKSNAYKSADSPEFRDFRVRKQRLLRCVQREGIRELCRREYRQADFRWDLRLGWMSLLWRYPYGQYETGAWNQQPNRQR